MSQGTTELIGALTALVDRRLSLIRTATMARVESVELDGWRVTVQPLIREPIGGTVITLTPIPRVPVWRPRSGGMILSLPVAAGDTGLLLILDRAAGEFKRLGGVVDPVDQRHHDLSDAIFLPGFVGPWGEELAGGPTASGDVIGTTTGAGLLTEDESQGFAIDGTLTTVLGDDVRLGTSTATDYVALASIVDSLLTTLKSAIAATVIVPTDGGASFKSTLLAALSSWPTPTGASKVKAV